MKRFNLLFDLDELTEDKLVEIQKKLFTKVQIMPKTSVERGCLTDKVQFIALLGNPYRLQTQTKTGYKFGSTKKERYIQTAYKSCGLLLKTSVPLEVPYLPLGNENEMSVNWEKKAIKKISAGEQFALTFPEALFFLAQPYFDSVIATAFDDVHLRMLVRGAASAKVKQIFFRYTNTTHSGARLGQVRENMILIGVNDNNQIYIQNEYKDKFGMLGCASSYQRKRRRYDQNYSAVGKDIKNTFKLTGIGRAMMPLTGQKYGELETKEKSK